MRIYDKISNMYKAWKIGKENIPFSIKQEEVSYAQGDYYSENGVVYSFEIAGDKYEIGHIIVVEDDDSWAQAESHEYYICTKNDVNISSYELTQIVDNYLQFEREYKLNKLGI